MLHPPAEWIARAIFEELDDLDHDEADWLLMREELTAAAHAIINEYSRLNGTESQ